MKTFILVVTLVLLTVALALGFVLPAAAATETPATPATAGGLTVAALLLIVGMCVVAWELVRMRL